MTLDQAWTQLTYRFADMLGGLNPVVAALLILAGISAVFYGRRFSSLFTASMGFLLGLAVAPFLAGPLRNWLPQSVILMIAVIAAFLGLAAHRPAAVLIGALAVGGIGRALAAVVGGPPWVAWALTLGGAALGVLLLWKLREPSLIAISALYGALATALGVRAALPALSMRTEFYIFLALLLAGLAVQIVDYHRLKELVIPPEAGGLPPRRKAVAQETPSS